MTPMRTGDEIVDLGPDPRARKSNLFNILVRYLEMHGWRFEPEEGAHFTDLDMESAAWWTRDEFKDWWKDPRTQETSDRYIDMDLAISEQINMETYGVSTVREMIKARLKASQ